MYWNCTLKTQGVVVNQSQCNKHFLSEMVLHVLFSTIHLVSKHWKAKHRNKKTKHLSIGSIRTVVASILAKGAWKLGEDLRVVACQPARPPPLIGPGIEIDPYWLRFTEINLSSLGHKEFKEYVSTAAKSVVEQVMFEKESGQALVKFSGKPGNLWLILLSETNKFIK